MDSHEFFPFPIRKTYIVHRLTEFVMIILYLYVNDEETKYVPSVLKYLLVGISNKEHSLTYAINTLLSKSIIRYTVQHREYSQ